VERTLAEAALGNEVKRWQRERSETLGLIARAQQRAIPGIEFASRGSAAELRQLAGNTRAAGAGSTRRAAPGYGDISRAGVVTLPAAQCSFIHEPGPRGPHYGPCQPRLGY